MYVEGHDQMENGVGMFSQSQTAQNIESLRFVRRFETKLSLVRAQLSERQEE